jgi:hypothetical protein
LGNRRPPSPPRPRRYRVRAAVPDATETPCARSASAPAAPPLAPMDLRRAPGPRAAGARRAVRDPGPGAHRRPLARRPRLDRPQPRRDGDLVTSAPLWTDPLARQYFADIIPLARRRAPRRHALPPRAGRHHPRPARTPTSAAGARPPTERLRPHHRAHPGEPRARDGALRPHRAPSPARRGGLPPRRRRPHPVRLAHGQLRRGRRPRPGGAPRPRALLLLPRGLELRRRHHHRGHGAPRAALHLVAPDPGRRDGHPLPRRADGDGLSRPPRHRLRGRARRRPRQPGRARRAPRAGRRQPRRAARSTATAKGGRASRSTPERGPTPRDSSPSRCAPRRPGCATTATRETSDDAAPTGRHGAQATRHRRGARHHLHRGAHPHRPDPGLRARRGLLLPRLDDYARWFDLLLHDRPRGAHPRGHRRGLGDQPRAPRADEVPLRALVALPPREVAPGSPPRA